MLYRSWLMTKKPDAASIAAVDWLIDQASDGRKKELEGMRTKIEDALPGIHKEPPGLFQ